MRGDGAEWKLDLKDESKDTGALRSLGERSTLFVNWKNFLFMQDNKGVSAVRQKSIPLSASKTFELQAAMYALSIISDYLSDFFPLLFQLPMIRCASGSNFSFSSYSGSADWLDHPPVQFLQMRNWGKEFGNKSQPVPPPPIMNML